MWAAAEHQDLEGRPDWTKAFLSSWAVRFEPPARCGSSCAPAVSPLPHYSHPSNLLLPPLHPPSLFDLAPREPTLTFSQDVWAFTPFVFYQAALSDVALWTSFICSTVCDCFIIATLHFSTSSIQRPRVVKIFIIRAAVGNAAKRII